MPVRRSARLKGLQQPVEDATTTPAPDNNNHNKNNMSNSQKVLDTVLEREEPPVVNTPAKPHTTATPKTTVHTPKVTPKQKKTPAKTPTSALTRPSHQEMHPSKAHQSTTKQVDSGLILGFNPIKKDAQGNVIKDELTYGTPTKAKASPASTYYGTPGFEFKFGSTEAQLSQEAKKLMESVREDVARIKAELVHDKVTSASREVARAGDRKIAQPKGKAGRFSNAHMAEFKKMDSIAGHASSFRATPGRLHPLPKTLKRTNSKANLDEPESRTSPNRPAPRPSPASALPSAKRVKHDTADNKRTSGLATPKPATSRTRSSIRSSLMTPTRSSMARASSLSLKPPRTTMIPSLARSPSTQSQLTRTPRTDFNPRFKSSIPTLGNLKSILRRHQPLFSKDPAKIAAGTHVAAPDFSSDLLLKPTRGVSEELAPTPSPKKRVEFTPISKSREVEVVISPSPSKLPTSSSFRFTSNVVYPTLPSLTPDQSSLWKPFVVDPATPTSVRHVRPSEAPVEAILPEIPGVPHGISHKKRHRAVDDAGDRENVFPAGPVSGERDAKRVKLGSPVVKVPISSPLKPHSHTPIRSSLGSGRGKTPASARAKSRGALSASRLNMLSQPKRRV